MLAVCVGLPPVILEVAGDGYVPLLCGVVLHAIRSNTSAMKYQRVFMFGECAVGNGFGQLEHGHGVHFGGVVAGNRVVVLEAQPVFFTGGVVQTDRGGGDTGCDGNIGMVATCG